MKDRGNALFNFAVISDTHFIIPDGTEQSLHSTHQQAAGRMHYLVQKLVETKPDFVVHLGDMIHPVPGSPQYGSTAKSFLDLFAEIDCPIYTIPGNHDIGDKFREGMPAAVVSQTSVDKYQLNFGNSYHAFGHQGCCFILINNPILNSGLPLETKQHQWLQMELEKNRGKRIFLMMHYPAFLKDPHEAEHYDNIDQPARSQLLGLIEAYRVEAVFAGHVHNFFYNQYANSDLYTVPSVAFVRQDYSEMFRIEPSEGYGRNDLDKLGYFNVSVFEHSHHVQFVRTAGKTFGLPEPAGLHPAPIMPFTAYPLTGPMNAPLGVELRHDWNEVTDIPFNYILDEFIRRKVRNDYPILAMWELGIVKVRVPVSDLTDPETRARMAVLHAKGVQFTVFSFNIPKGVELDILIQNYHLVSVLEIIFVWGNILNVVEKLSKIRDQLSTRIFLSTLAYTQEFFGSIDQYIRPGSRLQKMGEIEKFLDSNEVSKVIDGFAFRVGPDDDPWEVILGIDDWANRVGFNASVILQLASDSEAGIIEDDTVLAARVAIGATAAAMANGIDVFIDTFMDMDRGYYVRHGLVDRRYNPRLPGEVLRNLTAVTPQPAVVQAYEHGQYSPAGHYYGWNTQQHLLVLIDSSNEVISLNQIVSLPLWNILEVSGKGTGHDLLTGESHSVNCKIIDGKLNFDGEKTFSQLMLIVVPV